MYLTVSPGSSASSLKLTASASTLRENLMGQEVGATEVGRAGVWWHMRRAASVGAAGAGLQGSQAETEQVLRPGVCEGEAVEGDDRGRGTAVLAAAARVPALQHIQHSLEFKA